MAGGRTQIVGFFGAVSVALVLLFLTKTVAYLPVACLGGIITAAAVGLIEPSAWRTLARVSRAETVIAAVAMIGVILAGVLQALIVAVALSIVDAVRRSARPHDAVLGWVDRLGRYADVSLHPSALVVPGIVVYRLDDRLMFNNAEYVKGRIQEAVAGAETATRWLVFDAEGVSRVDATGIECLETTLNRLDHEGITLVFARAKSTLVRQFEESGLTPRIGTDRFFGSVEAAVRECTRRGDGSGLAEL